MLFLVPAIIVECYTKIGLLCYLTGTKIFEVENQLLTPLLGSPGHINLRSIMLGCF